MNIIFKFTLPGILSGLLCCIFFQNIVAQSCPGLGSLSLTISPNPSPAISAPFKICPNGNGTVSVTQNYDSYMWSTGATDKVISISDPGDYSVTVTNGAGCTGTATVLVLSQEVPFPQISAVTDTCKGQVNLNAGAGFSAISWSNGSTTSAISVTTSGNFEVTVTNAFGCTGTASYDATIPPLLQVNITGDSSLCGGNAASLFAAANNSASYQWSTGATISGISVAAGGTYSVTATSAHGCVAVDSISVIESLVNPPIITGPSVVCNFVNATLEVSNPFDTYSWSSGDSTATVVFTNTGTYTVTVTDTHGCTSTGSHTITSSTAATPQISAALYACNGLMILYADTGFATYLWNNNESGDSITVNASGVYAVTVTNAQGCSATNTYTISIPSLPSVSITGQDSICQGNVTTLSVPGGFTQYVWNDGSGNLTLLAGSAGIYAVTVTDNQGCTASQTFTVHNYASPAPVIQGISQICATGNAMFSVIGIFSQYEWSTGESTPGITTNIDGTYTVTVTSAEGCTGSDTHTLSVGSNLQPQIQEATYACDGQISLDAGIGFDSYNWSDGQTTSGISIVNPGVYSVTVSDGSGCTGTDVVTVSIPLPPSVQIIGNTAFCSGNSVDLSLNQVFSAYAWSNGAATPAITVFNGDTYTVTVTDDLGCTSTNAIVVQELSGPSPNVTALPYACDAQLVLSADSGFNQYAWSGPNGFVATDQQITITTNGNYTVVITDQNGCTGSDVYTANIPAQDIVSLSGPLQFCTGSTVQISASSGFPAYIWSNGQTVAAISVGTAGIYSVTATDALGCSSSATLTLGNFPQQPPEISGPTAACAGVATTLTLVGSYASIQWSDGSSDTSITDSPPFTVTVTVTDANGCTGTATHQVDTSPPPVIQIQELPYQCNSQITLDAGAGFTYAWEGPNGFSSVDQQAVVSSAGNYSVTVTTTDGCTGTASAIVSIPALSTLTVSGNSPICPDQTSLLNASTGFNIYQWSDGQNGAQVSVQQPGNYMVTATDGYGCTAEAVFALEAAPPLTPTVSGDTLICPGASTNFKVAENFATYTWSNGATASSITISQSGSYTVTVADINGCLGSAAIHLDLADLPIPDITQQPYQCQQKIDLSAGSGFDSYLWSTGSSIAAVEAIQSGTYTVTVTNQSGCTGTSSIQVNIPADPVVAIDGVNSLCQGASGLLTASANTLTEYQWSNGATTAEINIAQSGQYVVTVTDVFGCTATESHMVEALLPIISTENRTTCNFDDAGTQTITLTASNGCDSVLTIVTSYVPNKPGLALDLATEIEATIGQEIQINVGANFTIDSIVYQSPFALSCSNCVNPTLLVLSPGLVLVKAFDPEGCFATGETRIKANRNLSIYVPNAFQPGSSQNGFFDVFSGPEIQAVRNFHVFDRWGEELFGRENMPTNSPGTGWDGTFRGETVQPGVYVYYFEVLLADGSIEEYSGDITIVR